MTSVALLLLLALQPDPFPARANDSGMDQAWLAPTALTQPAGTFTLHDHELFLLGATMAPVERFQIAFAGTYFGGDAYLAGVTFKVRALDVGRFHAALLGGGGTTGLLGSLLGGGVAASYCLSASCGAVVSAYGLVAFHRDRLEMGDSNDSTAVLRGVSAIIPVADFLKVVAEIHFAGRTGCGIHCSNNAYEAIYTMAGVRVHKGGFATTLGLLVGAESLDHVEALPAFSLSYRFGGS